MSKKKEIKRKVNSNKSPDLANEAVTSCKSISEPKIESTPMKSWVDEYGKVRFVVDEKLQGIDPLAHVAGTKDRVIADNILELGLKAIHSIIAIGKSDCEKASESINIVFQSLNEPKLPPPK